MRDWRAALLCWRRVKLIMGRHQVQQGLHGAGAVWAPGVPEAGMAASRWQQRWNLSVLDAPPPLCADMLRGQSEAVLRDGECAI